MRYYCTLFDSFYLSRGIVLYNSLKETAKDFHLYIFAFDDLSKNILEKSGLEHATIISLKDFETPELLEVKKIRTKAEYCWTCTPSTISYVLKIFKVDHCTYIDSDLLFFSDPSVLVDELSENGKTVLITEHRFSRIPKIYEQKRAGRFCVQFVTFINESGSLEVLDKWRRQCIEWCYSRYEDGKFGDQKYLDHWPDVYDNIHVLEHQGGGIAPWNNDQYSFKKEYESLTGFNRSGKIKFTVVFYHFQYVKLLENGSVDIGWYYIPKSVKKLFYEPYLLKILEVEKKLNENFVGYKTGFTYFKVNSFKSFLKINFKKIIGYNILKNCGLLI